jgi:hypothetical protein
VTSLDLLCRDITAVWFHQKQTYRLRCILKSPFILKTPPDPWNYYVSPSDERVGLRKQNRPKAWLPDKFHQPEIQTQSIDHGANTCWKHVRQLHETCVSDCIAQGITAQDGLSRTRRMLSCLINQSHVTRQVSRRCIPLGYPLSMALDLNQPCAGPNRTYRYGGGRRGQKRRRGNVLRRSSTDMYHAAP